MALFWNDIKDRVELWSNQSVTTWLMQIGIIEQCPKNGKTMPLIIFEKAKLKVFVLKIISSFAKKTPKIAIFFGFFMEYYGWWLKESYFKKI